MTPPDDNRVVAALTTSPLQRPLTAAESHYYDLPDEVLERGGDGWTWRYGDDARQIVVDPTAR